VLQWLCREGISISRSTLRRRLKDWDISKKSITASTDAALIEAIDAEFHSTTHYDATIAANLTANGIYTILNQVQEVRLQHGWRRRAVNDAQIAEQRSETFDLVRQELNKGTVRLYGRELVVTHLRTYRGYRAREDDVRDALRRLDGQGTTTRKPGPRRKQRGGEFITRGLNGYGV
jgi:hypothetical protein